MAALYWGGFSVTLGSGVLPMSQVPALQGVSVIHLQVGKLRPRDLMFLSGTCG